MAEEAKNNLENKKKWVKIPFDQGDSQQASNKVIVSLCFLVSSFLCILLFFFALAK
jgi:hypothetical protein